MTPTHDMITAGVEALVAATDHGRTQTVADIFRAMSAAAPPKPVEPVTPVDPPTRDSRGVVLPSIADTYACLRVAMAAFHDAHERAGARDGLASERIFEELLAAHPGVGDSPVPFQKVKSTSGVMGGSGIPQERWSFDDLYIGRLSKTGRSLDSRIVPRPMGILLHGWYEHAARITQLLNECENADRSPE